MCKFPFKDIECFVKVGAISEDDAEFLKRITGWDNLSDEDKQRLLDILNDLYAYWY